MAEITRYIKHRRDTAANWTSNNPILLAGQLGIETDGLTTTPKFKIGDGVNTWTTLPYFYGGAASAQNLNNVLTVGDTTSGQDIKLTDDDIIQVGTTPNRYIGFNTSTIVGGLELVNLNSNDHIILQDAGGIHIDTTYIQVPQITASRILATDASNKITGAYTTMGSGTVLALSTSPTFTTDITLTAGTIANSGIVLRDYTGGSTYGAIYMGVTPNNTNYALASDGVNTQVNGGADSVYLSVANAALFGVRGNKTSGSTSPYTMLFPTSTGMTASTEVTSFAAAAHTIDFLAGAKALQRSYVWGKATYTANSPTTITDMIGHDFYEPLASTNVTATNTYAARFVSLNQSTYIKQFSSTTSGVAASGNLRMDALGGSSSAVILAIGGTAKLTAANTLLTFSPAATTTGATNNFTFICPANSGQTASTESITWQVIGNAKTWAAGALATQRFNLFTANTAAAAGTSTFTAIHNGYFEAPIAGANMTATNLYALGVGGHCFIANSVGVPSNNPTGGGILYVEAGSLKYRGSSGTVTTLGAA
jgi:hypothetical protein